MAAPTLPFGDQSPQGQQEPAQGPQDASSANPQSWQPVQYAMSNLGTKGRRNPRARNPRVLTGKRRRR